MSPHKQARLAFVSAVVLLCLSGLAIYVTIIRLLESEQWVVHTHEIQAALGGVDSAVARAGRARSAYITTGDTGAIAQFESAVPEIAQAVQHLRDLTKDNFIQQERCARLEASTQHRIELFRNSIKLEQTSPANLQGQADISRESVIYATETTDIMQQMREDEQKFLVVRVQRSERLFTLAVLILAITFLLALAMFSVHYRLLSAELEARGQAELNARDSEESMRRLTVRLLQLQDEERRKFSRELHDSLGQYLSGVKMNLDMLASTEPAPPRLLTESIYLLDQAISETRTISHLLHPPLLDEAGFASAAKWYVEGFAQRSGIEVTADLPDGLNRFPKTVELGLFRVLQESLTNIHRHSGSPKAEIALKMLSGNVLLTVRDFGRGVPSELLTIFQAKGTNAGVGLAGMRERIRELGGRLDIQSTGGGTLISVTMPLERTAPPLSAADRLR
ncbi:MAG TPA: CHASE3 domain-containing protein [Terriglobales bacterium]|jgi:signal transduction histidine kinase|nr:CHASE3 domain-containing protein [Terriglobales bacterium]